MTVADEVLAALRATAVERDRRGGHAAHEKALLRDAGLLAQAVPIAFGGQGAAWPAVYDTVRRVARVDSALAHLLAFHHLQVATVLIYGTPAQQSRWLRATVGEGLWWGNAMNPLDPRLVSAEDDAGQILTGTKGFCSGAQGSDLMTFSAVHAASGKLLLGVLATQAPGVTVNDDWQAIGQRQTDSVSVDFAQVRVPQADVLRRPTDAATVRHSLRTCLGQLILVNLYLGIAEGALEAARELTLTGTRPWLYAGVATAAEDPYRLQRFGEMHLQSVAAAVLADRAAALLQQAWDAGDAVTPTQRRVVGLAITEAKVLAHRASLFVSQELFDAAGTRAAQTELGLDRYWRNARTHTLHDPLDYKLRTLGRWALSGEFTADLYT